MAKYLNDEVTDAALEEIATGNTLTICSSQPTSRTEAVTTYKLADVSLTPGDGNGDFTIADGDSGGRKVTISQQADIPVDTTGNATHIAICDSSRLILVTTCDSQSVTSGNEATVPAFAHTIGDIA